MTNKRIVLAGGGTAGHVNPLLATASELLARGYNVDVLGTKEGLESELVPAAGLPLTVIPKTPLPRKPSRAWFSLPVKLREANRISRDCVRSACAVVGFGGYVSAPAYRAARSVDVPYVIHEQNARPGIANTWGARHAAAVGLTFVGTNLEARQGITQVVGLPLRKEIAALVDQRLDEAGRLLARNQAATALGLDPQMPTLVITGGSLGAVHLNQVMAEAAAQLPAGVQVLHLTGRDKADDLNVPWKTVEYLSEMELALAVADVVVCRSGAGTVAELAALGIPACFVPLPIGNGEQRLNAKNMVDAGGALIVDDKDFSADFVRERVFPLLSDPKKLLAMGRAAASTGVPDAAIKMADLVESVCGD